MDQLQHLVHVMFGDRTDHGVRIGPRAPASLRVRLKNSAGSADTPAWNRARAPWCERERGPAAELSSVEAEVVERADRSVEGRPFSPIFLVLIVAPLALGAMLLLKDFELVSSQPLWLYLLVIAVAGTLSVLVEPWGHAPDGSLRLYTCLAVHVTALTVVLYLSGWGPVLGMAYVFIALVEMQSWGTHLWRPIMVLSLRQHRGRPDPGLVRADPLLPHPQPGHRARVARSGGAGARGPDGGGVR